jgi:hypothetical protein
VYLAATGLVVFCLLILRPFLNVIAVVIPLLFVMAVAIDQFLSLGASLQQMFTDETASRPGGRCGRPTSGSVKA